ncbi:MAG: peptidyl-prolyl cis-trans isomerase [Chloroflexi bacterium]|nr:peptidyl-prolyl cis-trans isomerase [Chloroflexota bacterium]
MDKHESANKLLAALKTGTPEAFDAVASALAPNVFMMAPVRGEATGPEAVIQNLEAAHLEGVAEWEGPTEEPRGVRITAKTPGGQFPGMTWLMTFDPQGQIAQVLESRLRAAPSKPDPLRITEAMATAVNGAMDNGTPIVLGYVNEEGQPRLSFRGTTQAYSEDQLAVWARYEDAGLPTAIQKNPHVSVVYYARGSGNLIFEGRAHVDSNPTVRDHVFDHSPVVEQRADPERRGVAIIIDVDKVTGRLGGERVNMARRA